MLIGDFSWVRPVPRHLEQRCSTWLPRPWQVGQVCRICMKPWPRTTSPWPPHVSQVLGLVPGLQPSPRHYRFPIDRPGVRIAVTFETQVFKLAPGVDRSVVADHRGQCGNCR